MSATNRGGVRHKDDFYSTPWWVTLSFLMDFDKLKFPLLEPSCGVGAITEVIYDFYGKEVYNVDINRHFIRELVDFGYVAIAQDYTDEAFPVFPKVSFKTVMTNPPFSLAVEFIKRSFKIVEYGGFVIMLLPLNFLGSAKRRKLKLFKKWFYGVYWLSDRPSYTEDGGTDASYYAWFVWKKGYNGETVLRPLRHKENLLKTELGKHYFDKYGWRS